MKNKVSDFLSEQWYFIRSVKTGNYGKIPAKSQKFQLGTDHLIDLDAVTGKPGKCGDECIVFNRFELKDARDLGFGGGADWWMDVYLNGEKIFTTFPDGNVFSPQREKLFFVGKGRKGSNLLSVRIRRGNGWTFRMEGMSYASAHPSVPIEFTADPKKVLGKIKPMNAVNNGPIEGSRGRGNMETWQAAAIPYVRNHDASFCSYYGGEHIVDVHLIFPDFTKDPDDPASYDFTLTDWFLKRIRKAGSQVFYRLGSKIEHEPKKYGTIVPPDFKKWAVICEHIIRHYNEGWADGFKWDILYWEIWNEPDLAPSCGSPTWQGTPEQFFDLYRVAATHLKKCFPKLKIGGPAVVNISPWSKRFLDAMTTGKRVPLDFFSWHCYAYDLRKVRNSIFLARRMLDEAGYTKTESILDEWNYVHGWSGEEFKYTVRSIIGIKGAAYAAAVQCVGQDSPLDMLMYYDARPCEFDGLFGMYNFEPLKTYYVFLAWSKLVKLGRQIPVDTREKNGIYAVGASNGRKTGVMICRFFELDDLPDDLPITFKLKGSDLRGARLYLIDQEHDLEEVPYRTDPDGNLLFSLKANTVVYLEK